jgi:general secretion pathway protein D
MQHKFRSLWRIFPLVTIMAGLGSCEGVDQTWLKKYDYYAANPPLSKAELMKIQAPDARAQQAVAHTQTVLDQMADYDRPVNDALPRGEGGLISNFALPAKNTRPAANRVEIIGEKQPAAATSVAKRAIQNPPQESNPQGPADISRPEPQSAFNPPQPGDYPQSPVAAPPPSLSSAPPLVITPPPAPAPDIAPASAPMPQPVADPFTPPPTSPPTAAPPAPKAANADQQALEAMRQAIEGAANQATATDNAAPAAKTGNNPIAAPALTGGDQNVEINFNDTSLKTVVEFVFGQFIKQPFSIASDFQDKQVNWIVQGQYSPLEIKRLFDAFLDLQGVTVNWQGGFYSIANKTGSLRVSGGGELGSNTGIWRLRNLDASEALQIVRPFLSSPENAQSIPRTNVLIVHSTIAELRSIDNFLRGVDVDNFKDKRIIVYSPQNMSAEGLTTLLQALPQQLGMNTSEGKKQIEAAVISGAKRVVVVTDNADTRDVVLHFIEQVDRPGRKQRQVFYYGLRNQTVDDVRTTLTTLLPGIIPDAADITVVANAPTNSLVIGATADQYHEIKKVIDRLDYRVPSVMIDTTIVEVQLNENLAYGVEWFLGGRIGRVRGDISTNLKNATAIPTPAARLGVISLANNTFATLDLLAGETNLRVLSRPRVIVKNKATATIKSTDQVRIVKSVLTTNAQQGGSNLPQREFEDKEVGVSLQVTPRIAEDGTVNMAVKIQDSRQGATDNSSGEPQPTFNIREVNTELVSKNGETMMIGGLIRNTNSRVKSKVPFFGDLPFLGQAFSNTNDSDQRTELVIFLTPYLVVDELSARLVSEALSNLSQINPGAAKSANTPDLNLATPPDEKPKPSADSILPSPAPLPAPIAPAPQPAVMIPPPPAPPEALLDDAAEEVLDIPLPPAKPPLKSAPPSLASDPPPSPVPDSANPTLLPANKPLLQ